MLYKALIEDNIDFPDTIITDMVDSYTYAQINDAVLKMNSLLKAKGLSKGQSVLIINDNSINTVIVILTCIYAKVCFIMAPKGITPQQINYILSDASPKFIIDMHKEEGQQIIDTQVICTVCLENIVYLLYTSGSTGKPKGVMASETQVMFCIDAINERLKNTSKDRILCCLPLSFDYGLYQIFFSLAYKAYLVLPKNYVFNQIPQLLQKEKITAFPAMPTMLSMLVYSGLLKDISLPCLRYISSTGDNFLVPLIKKLIELLPHTEIIPMYGQTECKRVSIMPFGHIEKTLKGSCGLPLYGINVRLENTDADGKGELIVSGPNVMNGYLNADEESSEYFFYSSKYGKSLRTGDFFKIDNDGFLYFIARKRRIIKTNGYRIGASEIEAQIQEQLSVPYLMLRVLGLPDKMVGEKVLLCISSENCALSIEKEVRRIIAQLPKYQRPTKLYITSDSFPINDNGKIDDKRLLEDVVRNEIISL